MLRIAMQADCPDYKIDKNCQGIYRLRFATYDAECFGGVTIPGFIRFILFRTRSRLFGRIRPPRVSGVVEGGEKIPRFFLALGYAPRTRVSLLII